MSLNPSVHGMRWTTEDQSFFVNLGTDFWKPRVADARNLTAPILSLIPSTSERVDGKFIRFPVRYGHNWEATNNVREGGKLPDPKDKRYSQYAFRPRKNFTRIAIAGDVMRQMNSNPVRFADALSEAYDTTLDDIGLEAARMLYSDGSGRLAEVDVDPGTGTSLVLRMNSNLEGIATSTTTPVDNEFIGVGTRITIVSNAGDHRCTRDVTDVTVIAPGPPGKATVIVSAALPASVVVGDWVVRSSRDPGADNLGTAEAINGAFRSEPIGIGGIFQETGIFDGNGLVAIAGGDLSPHATEDYLTTAVGSVGFQGLPSDGTIPFNQGLVYDGGGILRPPTEELLGAIMDDIESTNNAQITAMLSNYGERRAYFNTLLPDRRFVNTMKLEGAIEVPTNSAGKPWIADRLCHKNCVYLLALESGGFEQSVRTEFQPLDPLGPAWHRPPDDDYYHTSYVREDNMSVDVRNRCGAKVTDISRASA